MRNTSVTITVPHLFSPLSALSAESRSHIIYIAFQDSWNASNKSIEFLTSYFKSRESSIHEQTNRKHITTLVLISCTIAET